MTLRRQRFLLPLFFVLAGLAATFYYFVAPHLFAAVPADVPVTDLPGAMKPVQTVPTEPVMYSGNVSFLRHIGRGRPIKLSSARLEDIAKNDRPPLVSPLARRANAFLAFGPGSDPPVPFFLDETAGKGTGYNRLYADWNADGRFAPEESVGLLDNPPPGAVLELGAGRRCLVFEPFDLKVSPSGEPRRLIARVGLYEVGDPYLYVTEPLRRAEVTLGGVKCSVFLQNWFPADYDAPMAHYLIEYAPGRIADYWPSNVLSIGAGVYRLTAASRGASLTVQEYVADAGTVALQIGDAWEGVTVSNISLMGSSFLTAVGPLLEEKREFLAPAGRYDPGSVSLAKGRAGAFLTAMPRENAADQRPGRLRVSNGGRSILDLGDKPEVLFTKPAKGAPLRPGDTLEVAALLACPAWDLSFRLLSLKPESPDDSSPGKTLEPQVTVKDSAGRTLASGVMPFG